MKYPIILIGDKCTGKTLNSEAIATAYGCDAILDDFVRPSSKVGASIIRNKKALVISTEHPRDPFDRRRKLPGTVISVKQAKKKLGNQWTAPKSDYCTMDGAK